MAVAHTIAEPSGDSAVRRPVQTNQERVMQVEIEASGRRSAALAFAGAAAIAVVGIGKSRPEIVTMSPRQGAKPKPLITGFPAPVVALGLSNVTLYAGDLTGAIYAVAL